MAGSAFLLLVVFEIRFLFPANPCEVCKEHKHPPSENPRLAADSAWVSVAAAAFDPED